MSKHAQTAWCFAFIALIGVVLLKGCHIQREFEYKVKLLEKVVQEGKK